MREETFGLNGSVEEVRSSREIVGKAGRRQFSPTYIDRILKELEEAPRGELGKIMRREG